MGVSKNRGKNPKMDGLYWKTLLKWMIWGYPYFWKHPYVVIPSWELISRPLKMKINQIC